MRIQYKGTNYITLSPGELGVLEQAVSFRIRFLEAKLKSRHTSPQEDLNQYAASLSQLFTLFHGLKQGRADSTYRTPVTHAEISDP